MTTTQKVERRSLVDRAYREIKHSILGNLYPPNFQMLEQDLASQLGMSRTPVREALIRLEKEGLVEIIPRRGMRVVPILLDDLLEIYDVMSCLECRAVERLAERKPSEEEIAPLMEALTNMEQALESGDLEAWARADDTFHRGLVKLCGNERLCRLAMTVTDQIHRARMVTLRMRPLPKQSNSDHRRTVEAILEGDAQTAREIHRDHLSRARRMVLGILRRYKLAHL